MDGVEGEVGAQVEATPDRRVRVVEIDADAEDRALVPARVAQARVTGALRRARDHGVELASEVVGVTVWHASIVGLGTQTEVGRT